MSLLGADPGGEPWFSRTQAQMLAENILIDANGISNSNAAPSGRATTYGYFSSGGSIWMAKGNFGNQATMTVGWAVYISSSAWSLNTIIFTWTDGTTHQIEVRLDASGHLFLTLNSTTPIAGTTSSATLSTGWHYIEITTTFSSTTTGTVLVKVDGATFINASSIRTSSTANNYTNRFYFQPPVPNTNTWYKDIYWRNDSTMYGDLSVNVCYPASAGPSQQFAPSAGSQLACVQDGILHTGTWPDDTTYIVDITSGHISDFLPQSVTVPTGGSIKAAIHVSRMAGDASGATVQQYTKSSSTVHTTSTISLTTSPAYYFDVMENDPATSAAWTQSGFNAATHGAKIP